MKLQAIPSVDHDPLPVPCQLIRQIQPEQKDKKVNRTAPARGQ